MIRIKRLFENVNRKTLVIYFLLSVIALYSFFNTRGYMYRHVNKLERDKAKEAFKEMYYPILDSIYESGDMSALQQEVRRLSLQEGAEALSEWPHISYLQYYTQGTIVKYSRSVLKAGKDSKENLSTGVWAALTILFKNDHYETDDVFSESERDTIREYVNEATRLLTDDLSMTNDQINNLYNAAYNGEDEIDYTAVEKYVSAYYENGRVFNIP